jgi:hypothetical protein
MLAIWPAFWYADRTAVGSTKPATIFTTVWPAQQAAIGTAEPSAIVCAIVWAI